MKEKLSRLLTRLYGDRRFVAVGLGAVGAMLLLASMKFSNEYLSWMMVAAILFVVVAARKLSLRLPDLLPALFVLSVFAHGIFYSRHAAAQPFVYLIAYLIGTNILSLVRGSDPTTDRRRARDLAITFFAIFAVGMAAHISLNMLVTDEISLMRLSKDFWTGETLAATLQSSFCILGIALSAALIFSDVRVWIKPIALALCILLSVYNLMLSGRALIVITAAAFGVAALFFFVECKKKRVRVLTALVILAALLLAAIVFALDIGGIRTYIVNTNFYKRFFDPSSSNSDKSFFYRFFLSDSRFALKAEYLSRFSLSLWGGNHIFAEVKNYAHDIFLDTYDAWGIIPLVLLVAYMIAAVVRALRVVFDRTVPFVIRQSILTLEISLGIIFMLEPILFGTPRLFIAFCFIDGIAAWYCRSRAERLEQARALPERRMTVAFFSSNLNHHMLPLCKALVRLLGEENFRFIATEPISEERLALGYEDMDSAYPFVIREYAGDAERDRARRICLECDVMIFGSAPSRYFKLRAAVNRPLFYYSERIDKPTLYGAFSLRRRLAMLRHFGLAALCDHAYLLCASAYAPRDFAKCGLFINRCYKWGYFPETDPPETPDELIDRKDPQRIVWVARFCGFKHPELAIEVARILRDGGVSFELDMIGRGELESDTREAIERAGLSDRVHLLGALPHGEVSGQMRRAGIFLMTSDSSEGWGAVMNEAMASACAIVTTDGPGSVPYLIENGKNGVSVPVGDAEALARELRRLLGDAPLRRSLGRAAVESISRHWNAEVAAERLVALSREILREDTDGAPRIYSEGICSRARRM